VWKFFVLRQPATGRNWIWFSFVAMFFSHSGLREKMLSGQGVLNKLIGTTLVGLGITLALAPMTR
jgi:threonine/homoserine/homoserine lactone efflux protein